MSSLSDCQEVNAVFEKKIDIKIWRKKTSFLQKIEVKTTKFEEEKNNKQSPICNSTNN
jgi:hypothetical protein